MQKLINKEGQYSAIWNWLLLILFIIYCIVGASHHDLWRDETQSWMLVIKSKSYVDLWQNIRYEGHPFGWFFVLYSIAALGLNFKAAIIFHGLVSVAIAYLILFKIKENLLVKICIIFGALLGFEYVFYIRNYNLSVLFLLLAFILFNSRRKPYLWIFVCLAFATQFNVYATIFSISFAGFILFNALNNKTVEISKKQVWIGAGIFFISLLFFVLTVAPPKNSEMELQTCLKFPLYEFLAYNLSLTTGGSYDLAKVIYVEVKSLFHINAFIYGMIFLVITLLYLIQVWRSNKQVGIFNVLFFVGIYSFFSVNSYLSFADRYSGFFMLLLLFSFNLKDLKVDKNLKFSRYLYYAGLILQFIYGIYNYSLQLKYPESNSKALGAYVNQKYPNSILIGNPEFNSSVISFYTNKKVFNIKRNQFMTYAIWDKKSGLYDYEVDKILIRSTKDSFDRIYPNQEKLFIMQYGIDTTGFDLKLDTIFNAKTTNERFEAYYLFK